jgi:cytochrome o ubiquinol oxidase subunit 2
MTWLSSHLLDPYRSLSRVAEGQPLNSAVKPLEIDAVALDWKWLFIYPSYGVATVNELAVPVDQPIDFHITASSVMNSFFVPDMAGQIYAMPGMETRLSAIMNKPGDFRGMSANYSGAGFSGMHFTLHSLPVDGFHQWLGTAKTHGDVLDRAGYLALEKPSENEPLHAYKFVEEGLFGRILNMCVDSGKMCMNKMSSIDHEGGLGLKGAYNLMPLEYDKHVRRGAVLGPDVQHVADICMPINAMNVRREIVYQPGDPLPLEGIDLSLVENK